MNISISFQGMYSLIFFIQYMKIIFNLNISFLFLSNFIEKRKMFFTPFKNINRYFQYNVCTSTSTLLWLLCCHGGDDECVWFRWPRCGGVRMECHTPGGSTGLKPENYNRLQRVRKRSISSSNSKEITLYISNPAEAAILLSHNVYIINSHCPDKLRFNRMY